MCVGVGTLLLGTDHPVSPRGCHDDRLQMYYVPDPGQRGSAEGTKSAAADTALPLEPLKGSNTKHCWNMDRTGEQKAIDSIVSSSPKPRQKMFPRMSDNMVFGAHMVLLRIVIFLVGV